MTSLAYKISLSRWNSFPALRQAIERVQAAFLPDGSMGETPESRTERVSRIEALGRFIASIECRLVRKALSRLPDSATLLELGTGLDPLEWLFRLGGYDPPVNGTSVGDRYAVVVQCSGATQRSNVEGQLDGLGLTHRRAPICPQEWWTTTGSAKFPGATKATWEICSAYAAEQSTQMERVVEGLADVAAVVQRGEQMITDYQVIKDEAEAG